MLQRNGHRRIGMQRVAKSRVSSGLGYWKVGYERARALTGKNWAGSGTSSGTHRVFRVTFKLVFSIPFWVFCAFLGGIFAPKFFSQYLVSFFEIICAFWVGYFFTQNFFINFSLILDQFFVILVPNNTRRVPAGISSGIGHFGYLKTRVWAGSGS